MTTSPPRWQDAAAALVAALEASGDLTSKWWAAAVEGTPRHRFVPTYYRNTGGAPTVWERLTEEADGAGWLGPIYTNSTLVTQLHDPRPVPGGWTGTPTSSSTQPSLMVRMLEALDIDPSHRVLEIGTATGYNAALICRRLDSARQLTTADIDSGLTKSAAARLDACGHRPDVVTTDATTHPWPAAGFDRIIATCALPEITPTLHAALAPGGKLIANLMPPLSGGLALLTRLPSGNLEGPFLPDGGQFMPARPAVNGHTLSAPRKEHTAGEKPTRVPKDAFDDYQFTFLLAAFLPGATIQFGTHDDGTHTRKVVLPGGASAEALYTDGEAGRALESTDHVWATVERCWQKFEELGRPRWDTFGLTVTDAVHQLWHKSPDNVVTSF